jgi:hypothetical protein
LLIYLVHLNAEATLLDLIVSKVI